MPLNAVKRRNFMALLGGAAAAWPLGVRAQSRDRMRRIGIVMAYAQNDPNGQTQVLALRDELQKFGWMEAATFGSTFATPRITRLAFATWRGSCSLKDRT